MLKLIPTPCSVGFCYRVKTQKEADRITEPFASFEIARSTYRISRTENAEWEVCLHMSYFNKVTVETIDGKEMKCFHVPTNSPCHAKKFVDTCGWLNIPSIIYKDLDDPRQRMTVKVYHDQI